MVVGVRPENIIKGSMAVMKVTLNENLGQTTLVHGIVGTQKLTAKFREWCDYDNGDEVGIAFDRIHFFDKETTEAIR